MSEQKVETLERRYKDKEVCEIYGIDRGTLRRWRKHGLIGFLQLPSGQIRYKQSHLDEFDRKTEKRVRKQKGEADAA